MLDFGFSELLLIAVAAILFIKPADLPVVIRHVAKFMREIRAIYTGIKRQVDEVMDQAGVNDLHQQVSTIIDLEGKPQKAYDVAELQTLPAAKPVTPTVAPSEPPHE